MKKREKQIKYFKEGMESGGSFDLKLMELGYPKYTGGSGANICDMFMSFNKIYKELIPKMKKEKNGQIDYLVG